ncbi:Two-component response regulator-like APRR7 [Gracilariopsis chorda]|uniref:Two-component response regulator-like APRR7 n=1 Tax=Gracilariopsis chorda TaxID=448386 RepID=A0A2V3IYV0_9FLOR|nr:Two-component response regulator-like APRR7 [Gracilariopsis chorda]|eukprot:PXF46310.1 Two-component response regulator-like APRR7 [Gracilariopsis chorda]
MALFEHPLSALPTAQDIELASALVSMKAGWRAPYVSSSTPSKPALTVSTSPTHVLPSEAPPPPPPARLPRSSSLPPAPYDYAQRQQAIQRYREKRRRRGAVGANSIRYQIRKKLADTRPRVRGRFFKVSASEAKA